MSTINTCIRFFHTLISVSESEFFRFLLVGGILLGHSWLFCSELIFFSLLTEKINNFSFQNFESFLDCFHLKVLPDFVQNAYFSIWLFWVVFAAKVKETNGRREIQTKKIIITEISSIFMLKFFYRIIDGVAFKLAMLDILRVCMAPELGMYSRGSWPE